MQLGAYEITDIRTGSFRLDGGAMFGSIPKAIWGKDHDADADNRIELALRCLYLEGMGRRILVDTGIGDKWDDKLVDRMRIEPCEDGWVGALARADVLPEQITDVILTHLHFDHAGGATTRDEDGELQPTFPNAVYHLQRRNLEWAKKPNPKERASYRAENYQAIEQADRFILHDGPRDLFPEITALLSNGHTEGLQIIRVRGEEDEALYYPADLIPTTSHVRLPFCMGYDNHVLQVIEEKRALLTEAANNGHWIFYEHDPRFAASRIEFDGERFTAVDCLESLP